MSKIFFLFVDFSFKVFFLQLIVFFILNFRTIAKIWKVNKNQRTYFIFPIETVTLPTGKSLITVTRRFHFPHFPVPMYYTVRKIRLYPTSYCMINQSFYSECHPHLYLKFFMYLRKLFAVGRRYQTRLKSICIYP